VTTTGAASHTEASAQAAGDERPRTIAALWREATSAGRTTDAYLVERDGAWSAVGWDEAARRVDELAHGLLDLGVGRGDTVVLLGATGIDWVVLDYALALVGAVSVPIYANSSPAETTYIVAHSRAVAAFVEDDEQRGKVDAARAEAAALRDVLSFADLDELAARGRRYAAEHPAAVDEAAAAVGPEDLYTVIYTSGTTGPPKGCLIRHRNYFAMASCLDQLPHFVGPDDLMLLFLPLAHNFGRLMHLMGAYVGFTTALLADPYRAVEAFPQVRPTVVPSVPRVYEKVAAAVQAKFDQRTGIGARLVSWALNVGRRTSELRREGRQLPRSLAAQHRIADRLVYAKVKERLGGRFRFGISGGAPLAPEIAQFLHTLDVLVLEGYGLTECTTAASVNRPNAYRFGTVGPALPGFELRIADDGEVLIRSDTVFGGYLHDEAATREVLDGDGWLRSGDMGSIDADGFLSITGRKKDILITAAGKNVAPQNVENALRTSPLVSQAMAIGDCKPYVVALLTLDAEALATWADERGLRGGADELSKHPEVTAVVADAVARANEGLSRHEQVKRFAILPHDFSIDSGELTVTLKVRRREVEQRHEAEIDALYAGDDFHEPNAL
jgi:long-chain acyl-CoA synthetase